MGGPLQLMGFPPTSTPAPFNELVAEAGRWARAIRGRS
jgi:hypothetical protein